MDFNVDRHMDQLKELLISGSEDDIAYAVDEIKRLSGKGVPLAQYALATWKIHGSYKIEVDLPGAEDLLKSATEGMVVSAFHDYATLLRHRNNDGDDVKSLWLLVAASIMGDMDSLKALSGYLQRGYGCPKSDEASEYLERIISRNSPQEA